VSNTSTPRSADSGAMKAASSGIPPITSAEFSDVLRGTSRRSDEAQDHPGELEEDGEVASQALSIVRQKPTTVATPASSSSLESEPHQ
jgi:hypothetical protein